MEDNPCESLNEYKSSLQVYIENPKYTGLVMNDRVFRNERMKNLEIMIKLLKKNVIHNKR